MRIGLNLLHALPEIGGGWNYIHGLVGAVARYGDLSGIVAFVHSESAGLVQHVPGIEAIRCPIDASNRPARIVYEHLRLPSLVRQARVDCVHHFAGTLPVVHSGRAVVTVHDLLVYRNPRAFPFAKRRYLRLMGRWTARKADLLLPVSRSTADDLQTFWGIDPGRMVVIPAVLDEQFRVREPADIAAFRVARGLPDAFWLYVAHGHLHKNHDRLLAAFATRVQAGTAQWPLVLRGERLDAVRTRVSELGLTDKVVFLERLPADEMPLLFAAAGALVFPSTFEGGGIPLMEAMACACPVAASRIPTTLEFGGDSVLLFDPTVVSSIAAAMDELESSSALRHESAQKGLRRVGQHRPKEIANLCRQSYERAIA
jgi:glycosyltransferase involved in cell wall biosynthesis